MPKLSDGELTAFLAEPGHLLRVATVDADGMPRVVPIWFIAETGAILFTPRQQSVFWHNLQRDDRVGLSIDEADLPYRKVTVQGRVELVHPAGEDDRWRDTYRAIAGRYIDAPAVEAYIEGTIDQPRPLLRVDLASSRISTWRMPLGGEPGRGIWAGRYYAEGSRLA